MQEINKIEFVTIRQAARRGPLSENRLRAMRAQGKLPGFPSGNRFYVDYGKLLRMLDKLTDAAADNVG